MAFSNTTSSSNEEQRKRRRSGSPSADEGAEQNMHKRRTKFPRYFIVEGTDTDRPMSLNTPTKGNLILKGLIGTVEKVIRLSNGDLIVGLQREGQADNLLGVTLFGLSPCRVTSYDRMNTKKGVIRCPAFRGIKEEEIVEDLEPEGVVGAQKIMFKRDGKSLESATIILTFDCSVLPKEIKAGYLNIKVEPYIPNPLRCFQCNKFGHPKDRCKRKACCARCGSLEHTSDAECKNTPHCVNCDGEHSSFSKDCPKWKEEKEIQRVRITQNISFHQARQQVTPTPAPGHLFSDVARKKVQTSEVSTQTNPADLNCPLLNTIYPSIHPLLEPSASHHSQSLSESDTEIVPPTQTTNNKLSRSQKRHKRQKESKDRARAASNVSTNQAMDISVAPQKGPRSPIKPP
jgi:hypothetical protein